LTYIRTKQTKKQQQKNNKKKQQLNNTHLTTNKQASKYLMIWHPPIIIQSICNSYAQAEDIIVHKGSSPREQPGDGDHL